MPTHFQTTIEHLLQSHQLLESFQSQLDFHVRFDMSGYQRLIEILNDEARTRHWEKQTGEINRYCDLN